MKLVEFKSLTDNALRIQQDDIKGICAKSCFNRAKVVARSLNREAYLSKEVDGKAGDQQVFIF